DLGHGAPGWPRHRHGARRREAHDGLPPRSTPPLRQADRPRVPRVRRRALRHRPSRRQAPRAGAPGRHAARRTGRRARRDVLARHEAAVGDGRRAHAPAAHPRPRRADGRPRSRGRTRVEDPHRGPRRRRRDGLPLDAQPRGGRGGVRSHRHPRPGSPGRAREPRRPTGACEDGRRRRGPGTNPRGRVPGHPAREGREVTVAALLRPRGMAVRNMARRHPRRIVGLSVAIAALWAACLVTSIYMVRYFQTIGDFGPALTQRLLILLFGVFLGILALSATIAALQTFYLASDVSLLLSTPVGFRRLHHARFIETLVASSWMVLIFGLPVFLASGCVYEAGPIYYAALVAVLGTFVVIPTALGVLVATALVLVFPARGARDTLAIGVG